jgi:hypothetical protein
MKRRATGFSLAKLVAAFPLILAAFALASVTIRMLASRGPALRQRAGTYTALRHLVRSIETDVAEMDPERVDDFFVGPEHCVLPLSRGRVVYRLGDREVTRVSTDIDGAEQKSSWAIPGGRIKWASASLAGGVRGVRLTISADGFEKQKLAALTNSYLFVLPREENR